MSEPVEPNIPANALWDVLGGAVSLATGTGLPAHLIVAALVRITGAVIAIEEHHDQASADALRQLVFDFFERKGTDAEANQT